MLCDDVISQLHLLVMAFEDCNTRPTSQGLVSKTTSPVLEDVVPLPMFLESQFHTRKLTELVISFYKANLNYRTGIGEKVTVFHMHRSPVEGGEAFDHLAAKLTKRMKSLVENLVITELAKAFLTITVVTCLTCAAVGVFLT